MLSLNSVLQAQEYTDSQTIRYGLVEDFTPFTFVNEKGEADGFYIELFTEIISEFGYVPEFTAAPFNDLYPMILNNEIDMFSTILRLENRETLFHWPDEPTVTGWGQFFIKAGDSLDDIYDLQHNAVAVVRDEAQGQAFRDYIARLGIIVDIVEFESFEEMTNAVLKGDAIGGVAHNTYLLRESRVKPTGIIFSPLSGYTTCSATNFRMIPLIDQFSARLQELKQDPDSYYWRMYRAWFETDEYIPAVLPDWFTYAAVAAALLVFILLLFSWVLQGRVNAATRELKNLNDSLEEKVARRTRDLEKAAEKLADSEKASITMRLVSGIAHEVNTPIGIAVTATSHIEEEIKKIEASYKDEKLSMEQFETFLSEAGEVLSMTSSNLKRAADLISDFRNVSSDQIYKEKRDIELDAYIRTIIKSIQPQFKKTKHKIHLALTQRKIETYPDVLIHVILNLIMNSLTHGFSDREEGHIYISPFVKDGLVRIVHSDSGCGIPQESLTRIFEPFYTSNRNGGNTGLGLSIVYNLINDVLKGTIQVESRPGVYTKFVVEFKI
ncbi:MAG: ATP-binding protein [Spirochaetales bacterium]|nr:ATP-binding protein [Spirochaetales bacterium]